MLFITFFKISPITFGGGYAMLPIIEAEVVKKLQWIDEKELINIFTMSQTVPGAVAVNTAIFLGFRIAGLIGALAALIGILIPTLIIVVIIYYIYYFFHDNLVIQAAFNGIGSAVVALILQASYTIGKKSIIDRPTLFITIISVIFLFLFKVNPIVVIIGGLILGISLSKLKILIARKKSKKIFKNDIYPY